MVRVFLGVALALGLTGCTLLSSPSCSTELEVTLSPRDTTIATGTSFTAAVETRTCGGHQTDHPPTTWLLEEPGVVAVDSTSGKVEGLATGDAKVDAVQRRGSLGDFSFGTLTVHVR